MSETNNCSRCGAALAATSPGGHCVSCLLQLALAAEPLSEHKKVAEVSSAVEPGARIGRYHLLEQIGEGGCGVVFLAEQFEPVRREVAIKVIKPGMDSR